MRKEITQVTYQIEMTVDEFTERGLIGNLDDDRDAEVHNALCALPGIIEVEFDGHFGPNVFLTVEADQDDEYLWKKVWKILEGTDDGTS